MVPPGPAKRPEPRLSAVGPITCDPRAKVGRLQDNPPHSAYPREWLEALTRQIKTLRHSKRQKA